MLRAIVLILSLCVGPAAAMAQNADAAAGQALGTTLRGSAPLPSSNGAGGYAVPTGRGGVTTIKPSDLVPSGGASSNLGSQAGSDAGILGAATNATNKASTDKSEWGEAYRTLGKSTTTRRPSLKGDPMWQGTTQAYKNILSKNFTGCKQVPGGTTYKPVHIPDIKHCVNTVATPMSCTVTHGLGSNVIPATKRCDPATFQTIKLQIYNTPSKKIWDNIACTPQGNFQHNLVASTTKPVTHTCYVLKPNTKTCSITHSYSVKQVSSCQKGTVLQSKTVKGILVPHQYGGWYGYVTIQAICGTPNSGVLPFYISGADGGGSCDSFKWYRNLGHFSVNATTAPSAWTNAGSIYYVGWNGYFYCYAAPPIKMKSLGCSGNQCSVKFRVDMGTKHWGCSDGGALNTYRYRQGRRWRTGQCCGPVTWGSICTPRGQRCWRRGRSRRCTGGAYPVLLPDYSYVTMKFQPAGYTRKVIDNGWHDLTPGCTATAKAILAGRKKGTVVCSLDPSHGGNSVRLPGGVVYKSDMASPFKGISSLCQRVTVTESVPGKDTCKPYANDPKCTQTKATPVSALRTDYTYSCNVTTTTSQLLSNCGGATGCSANL